MFNRPRFSRRDTRTGVLISMKRFLTLSLTLSILCAGAAPAMAQRGRDVRVAKTKTAAAESRFASVRAYSDGNGVLVEWQMEAEKNSVGFQVYRLDGASTEIASRDLIPGSAVTTSSGKYSFFDPAGTAGSVYTVQVLTLDGRTAASPSAAVEPVADLREVGPDASADRARQIENTKLNGNVTSNKLRMPKELAQEVAGNRPAADPTTHAWVVSQPGVKIGVRTDGFYRVSKTQLQNAGFNVAGDPALWRLFRSGVEQAMIVATNGDYIEFWARGIDTPESDIATYYLVSGPTAGKRIASRVARPLGGTVTSASYSQSSLFKQRTNFSDGIQNGELGNFWGTIVFSAQATSYTFNLTGVDFAAPQATLDVSFHGLSFDAHTVQLTINGTTLADVTGNAQVPYSKSYVIPTSYLREGTNTLGFRSAVSGDTSFFDSVNVGFARKFVANQNRIQFYTSNYRLSKLEGFTTQNVRVFDMTAETAPILWTNLNIVQEGPTYSVRMPAARGRSMFAVEDSAILQPVSITQNDPAILKSNTNTANLLIISHKNWMTEAQNWANYRAGQGVSVKLVEVSEIFDEFNYGDINSLAIRDLLQYAENNWQSAPNYVLLIGDASFDPRNYLGEGSHNYVPTHMVNTQFIETGSDDFLADFNGDGLAEMAVGRIPARSAQAVTNVLAKVTAFEAATPMPTLQSRGVLFAYDCYDSTNNYNFQQYSIDLRNQLPGAVPSTMIGRCDTPTPPDTPQSLVISSMNTGKLLVNYSGHGTRGAWQTLFSIGQVPQLTNANNLSIYTMLTCLNGYFHHYRDASLAENLLESTNGGAVAAWASTGETLPDEQNAMARRFYQKMSFGPLTRMGDLVNDAKTVISGGSDVRLSWALIGDPMLKVRNASSGDRPAKQR